MCEPAHHSTEPIRNPRRQYCMKRHLLTALTVVSIAVPVLMQAQSSRAALTTPHFAFYSDLATNTHDALIAVATARRARQPDPFSASEQACFARLAPREREAWNRAIDDYAAANSTNPQRYYERMVLAGLIRAETVTDPADREFLRTWIALRDAATPAYRRCRWPAQDRMNRQWIARVKPLLADYEQNLGDQLPRLFATPWAGLPFRVDVVNVAGFSGANSADRDQPPTLHILVSSTNPSNQGPAALETVFHEASHFLSAPDSPLAVALQRAAMESRVTLPPDFVHQVHFFLTGEAVRRAYAQRGASEYTPYLFALKLFSDQSRESISRTWGSYVDGARTLDQAAHDVVQAMTPRPQ
jgi:hypothetical protein